MKEQIREYNAVWIEWIDSVMRLPVWFTPEKIIDDLSEQTDRFYTISYLVHENKKEYVLASSIHFDSDGVSSFGQIFTIPKGCVIKIKKLKQ